MNELAAALEALVDRTSIVEVSYTLVNVCRAKADRFYLAGEEAKGKAWERCARALDRAGDTLQSTCI